MFRMFLDEELDVCWDPRRGGGEGTGVAQQHDTVVRAAESVLK
jgi:hypothetical protein